MGIRLMARLLAFDLAKGAWELAKPYVHNAAAHVHKATAPEDVESCPPTQPSRRAASPSRANGEFDAGWFERLRKAGEGFPDGGTPAGRSRLQDADELLPVPNFPPPKVSRAR